jgi:hypothetical protein
VVPTTVVLRVVGSTTERREGDTTTAEGQRMTAADVVAQVRDGQLEDFVREKVTAGVTARCTAATALEAP